VPVGTLAIGDSGAKNAALLAASILALHDDTLADALDAFRARQTESVVSEVVDGDTLTDLPALDDSGAR
jgi:5-(carboxyamino)imidazole ribonucleotide mutase